ncbi:MAG TPA: O-antigen ligase family protein, partial [Gemmataceae bacterium]|nr:O-antigen ligase family protein [Gemmataceae bacterium]
MIWLLGGYMWLFIHRPFEVWPVLGTLQIERIYMIGMLLLWLFSPKGWVANRIHWVTAFFSVFLLASWLLSPYMDETSCSATIEDYFKVLVFYVLVVTTVRDERSLKLLITLYLAAVGVYMAHSFWEFLCGRYEYRMGIRRMIGVDKTFGDPNAFASSLLYTVPLVLSLWMTKPGKTMRRLLAAYLLGACLCIVLTGSRAGFIGLCFCGFLMLLLSVRRKGMVLLLSGICGVLGLGVATVALPSELQNRYLTILDSSYGPKNAAESANSRLNFFLEGCRAWQSSPLIGHGPRSFDIISGHKMGSHNLYGQVLCEMGTLGALTLAAFVVCFVLNWLEVRRYYQSNPEHSRDFLFYLSRNLAI